MKKFRKQIRMLGKLLKPKCCNSVHLKTTIGDFDSYVEFARPLLWECVKRLDLLLKNGKPVAKVLSVRRYRDRLVIRVQALLPLREILECYGFSINRDKKKGDRQCYQSGLS